MSLSFVGGFCMKGKRRVSLSCLFQVLRSGFSHVVGSWSKSLLERPDPSFLPQRFMSSNILSGPLDTSLSPPQCLDEGQVDEHDSLLFYV